jgi:hypothetical protein
MRDFIEFLWDIKWGALTWLVLLVVLTGLVTRASLRSDREWSHIVEVKECRVIRERAKRSLFIPGETCWLCADGIERCR